MPIQFYQLLHFIGIILVFFSFGSILVRSMAQLNDPRLRKLAAITNGVGLLLTLVAGFGLLAKMDYGFPGWVLVKIAIWVAFGGLLAVINRKPELCKMLYWATSTLPTNPFCPSMCSACSNSTRSNVSRTTLPLATRQ